MSVQSQLAAPEAATVRPFPLTHIRHCMARAALVVAEIASLTEPRNWRREDSFLIGITCKLLHFQPTCTRSLIVSFFGHISQAVVTRQLETTTQTVFKKTNLATF